MGGSSGGGDGESGFVSDVFDSAACVVSGFIGGGNPKCHGKGKGDVEKSSSSSSSDSHNDNDSSDSSSSDSDIQDTSYNYKYDTNDDGKYVITIQPNAMSKDDCKETYDPKDGELKELVSKAAAKCFE